MNARQAKIFTQTAGAVVGMLSGVFLLRGIQLLSAASITAVLPIALGVYSFYAGYRAVMRFAPATVRHVAIVSGCWLVILGNVAIRAFIPPGPLRGLLSLVLLSAVIALCYWSSRRLSRALTEDQGLV